MTQGQLYHAALEAYFSLTERWSLTETEERALLGNPAESDFLAWKSERKADWLSTDALKRISYLIGIGRALGSLLPSEQSASSWVGKANSAPGFNGRSALSRMLSGNIEDIAAIHSYLDSQVGAE